MGSASVAEPSSPNPPPTWNQNTQQPPTPSSKFLSADTTRQEEDPETVIGSVLKNGRLTCSNSLCAGKSFGRQAELNRHYDTTHAAYIRVLVSYDDLQTQRILWDQIISQDR
jgi:hypothetical protein